MYFVPAYQVGKNASSLRGRLRQMLGRRHGERKKCFVYVCSIYLYLVRYACYAMPLLFIRYLEVKTPLHTHEFLYCTFIYIIFCTLWKYVQISVSQSIKSLKISWAKIYSWYTLLEKTLESFASPWMALKCIFWTINKGRKEKISKRTLYFCKKRSEQYFTKLES